MERVMLAPAAIDFECRRRGQVLFVDTDGRLKMWGLPSKRDGIRELLFGNEEEMKRFLIARALRVEGELT
jgi:hypothetical protein